MMYWSRLDLTPWVRYVPTTYYKMADELLDRKLRRGEVPPSWGNLDGYTIVYPDSETESVVDDKELDPDYASPAKEAEGNNSSESTSSENEEDTDPKKSKKSGAESGSKHPHISSSDDSDEAPATSRRKDHKRLRLDSLSGHKSKSKAKKSFKSSGNRSSRHRSRLARKEYDSLTASELMTIEVPDDDETSWRHLGILVQYVSTSRNSSGQNPGFPDYEVHKYASDLATKRWDSDAYVELEKSEPWTVMFEGRHRVLFFHRRSTLSLYTLKMLVEIVRIMHTNARAFWECGHWVTIDQEADDFSLAIHSGRVTRRNALRRRYQSLVKRALATPGFVKTLLYEPGLWKLPDQCCAWIWQDPRVEKLGGPKCDDLEIQLAETDLREPAPTQCDCERAEVNGNDLDCIKWKHLLNAKDKD